MNRSDSIASLAAALCKAQGGFSTAIKGKTNPAFKSKYADLGSVWEAALPSLQENGLGVVQLPLTDEPGYAALETIILHSSGEFISSTCRARIVKDDPQGYGSAITFLRRYALSAALGIVADEDDDGHAASAPRAAQRAQQAPARPSAPPTPAPGTLTAGQAAKLHRELGAILKDVLPEGKTQEDFAARTLGRPIEGFTGLPIEDAKRVKEAAEAAQRDLGV